MSIERYRMLTGKECTAVRQAGSKRGRATWYRAMRSSRGLRSEESGRGGASAEEGRGRQASGGRERMDGCTTPTPKSGLHVLGAHGTNERFWRGGPFPRAS